MVSKELEAQTRFQTAEKVTVTYISPSAAPGQTFTAIKLIISLPSEIPGNAAPEALKLNNVAVN